ncbi:hypothetical protein [Serratia sp. M24T3]|uniref:hypothetical protein n=1 Tax=Serratia sp. M24T3 TaxID=932213 RepID=UPI00025BC3BD|nr:hypothetical protein [Serratia sp. M24T3]EIC82771.1 hypothetical protein SPM24T3_20222 [Serratia sp. M24T3]
MTSIKPSTANAVFYPSHVNQPPSANPTNQSTAQQMVKQINGLKSASKMLESNTSAFNKKCNKALRSLDKIVKYPDSKCAAVAVAKLTRRMDKIYESSKFAELHAAIPTPMDQVRTRLLTMNLDLVRDTLTQIS